MSLFDVGFIFGVISVRFPTAWSQWDYRIHDYSIMCRKMYWRRGTDREEQVLEERVWIFRFDHKIGLESFFFTYYKVNFFIMPVSLGIFCIETG